MATFQLLFFSRVGLRTYQHPRNVAAVIYLMCRREICLEGLRKTTQYDFQNRRSTWNSNPVPSTNEAGFVRAWQGCWVMSLPLECSQFSISVGCTCGQLQLIWKGIYRAIQKCTGRFSVSIQRYFLASEPVLCNFSRRWDTDHNVQWFPAFGVLITWVLISP